MLKTIIRQEKEQKKRLASSYTQLLSNLLMNAEKECLLNKTPASAKAGEKNGKIIIISLRSVTEYFIPQKFSSSLLSKHQAKYRLIALHSFLLFFVMKFL